MKSNISKKLQNEKDGRMIICDEKLEKLTGKKKFNGTKEMGYFIQLNLSDDTIVYSDNPNQELVDLLLELANFEMINGNVYKSIAYRKAAGNSGPKKLVKSNKSISRIIL